MKTPRKSKQWLKELEEVLRNVLLALDDEVDDAQNMDTFSRAQVNRMLYEISYEISQRRGIDISRIGDIIPQVLVRAVETAADLPAESKTSESLIMFLYLHTHLELGLMSQATLHKILEYMKTLESYSAL